MSLAKEQRPDGDLIIQKVDQYEKVLGDSNIDFARNKKIVLRIFKNAYYD